MKFKATYFIVVILIIAVVFIFSKTFIDVVQEEPLQENQVKKEYTSNYPYPRGVLFENDNYTYFIEHVTDPGPSDAFMVAGYNGSSTIEILENGVALVTFTQHPKDWNGGGTLAQRPVQLDPSNVNFDLSKVSTISFEIKSTDFDVNQISFGVQWEGPNYDIQIPSKRSGGEKLFTLSQLGVSQIKDWTKVSIDVSPNGDIPDTATTRHEHIEIAFHADAGNTFVKVPLMMIWAGRTHTKGESFEIRNIAFQNANGEHVEIAANILTKAYEHALGETVNDK